MKRNLHEHVDADKVNDKRRYRLYAGALLCISLTLALVGAASIRYFGLMLGIPSLIPIMIWIERRQL